eukprot:jgi/Botrbrau1/22344/Bobra.0002s0022.1
MIRYVHRRRLLAHCLVSRAKLYPNRTAEIVHAGTLNRCLQKGFWPCLATPPPPKQGEGQKSSEASIMRTWLLLDERFPKKRSLGIL